MRPIIATATIISTKVKPFRADVDLSLVLALSCLCREILEIFFIIFFASEKIGAPGTITTFPLNKGYLPRSQVFPFRNFIKLGPVPIALIVYLF